MSIFNKYLCFLCLINVFLPVLTQAKSIDCIPQESNSILINPDIGITDHQTIDIRNDRNWNEPSYPETTVVYFRWYWEQLEPQKGVYNFQLIDNTLQSAQHAGKKVVIRFMTLAGLDETYYAGDPHQGKKILGIPCWLKQQLDPKTDQNCADDNSFVVDYKNPIFDKNLNDFVTAMGKRYNKNPNILRLDVGLVGTWGEWHLGTHYPDPVSTLTKRGYRNEDLLPYIDMMRKNFPDKMLTIDLGTANDNFTGPSTKNGLGWRADCFGDWSHGWNHMQDAYPETLRHIQQTTDPHIMSRWKHAPVDFEICTNMQGWAQQPDIYTPQKVEQIFDSALKLHASLFNLKSQKIPAIYQPALSDFIKKLGYRFVIKHVNISGNFKPNTPIVIKSDWTNVGSAPSYNNYPVVWRLVDKEGNVAAYFETNNDIRAWFPSQDKMTRPAIYQQNNTFVLPESLPRGRYNLEVGLVTMNTHSAVIKLAIENNHKNNWYEVTQFTIR